MPRQRLTHTAIASLLRSSRPRLVDYADVEVPGLYLRILSSGVATWFVRWRAEPGARGKRPTVRLGRYPVMDPAEARLKARELLRTATAAPGRQALTADTLECLWGIWVTTYEKTWKPRTRQQITQVWARYLAGPLGRVPRAGLTRERLEAVHHALTTSAGPTTANRSLHWLRACCQWAETRGYLFNVALLFRRFPWAREARQSTVLTLDELRAVYAVLVEGLRTGVLAGAETDPAITRCLLFILESGLRSTEARQLAWHQIHPGVGILFEDSKSGPQWRFLSRRAQRVLGPAPVGAVWCFESAATGQPVVGIHKPWRRVVAAAGLQRPVRLHDLRHTWLTEVARASKSLAVTSTVGGHRDRSSTLDYLHATGDALQQGLAAYDDVLPE